MKPKLSLLTLSFFIISAFAGAQENKGGNTFSLKEAQDYALKNNPDAKMANIEYELSLAKKNEIRGMGLPQVSASLDNRYNQRTIFASLIDKQMDNLYKNVAEPQGISRDRFDELVNIANAYSAQQSQQQQPSAPVIIPGVNTPQEYAVLSALGTGLNFNNLIGSVFNSPHNATANLQASQLVFSSDYIIALKAAKALAELSSQSVVKTQIDIKVAVTKAYYNVLVSRERFKLLDLNITRLEKALGDTKAFYEKGFVEGIDLDRLEVALNNLKTEKEKVTQLLELGEAALKFQMGYDLNQPINLTDNLAPVEEMTPITDSKVNFNSRADYAILKSSEKLGELDLKRYKLSFLPTLAAYGSLQYQAFGLDNKFDFYKNETWYRVTVVGATLNMKLFTGGQGHYKTKQAELNLLKTQATLAKVEQGILLETASARIMYNNALSSFKMQKRNIELAENIYKVSKAKYDQGVGSNLELLNAEISLKEAQTNYFNSLYDFYIAKVDYEKATGALK